MAKKETKENASKEKKPDMDTAPQTPGLPVNIMAQYIRDVSFENPNAPNALRPGQAAPQMDINIGMDARKLPDEEGIENFYEVVLSVRAEATRGEDVVFIAEVTYGVTLTIGSSVPEDNHHPLLLIEIPRMAFPYVREIISSLTIQGGFPPLMLNPVDFHSLYMQRFEKDIKEAQAKVQKELREDIAKAN